MKKALIGFYIFIVLASVGLIYVLATGTWKQFFYQKPEEQFRTQIVTPRETGSIIETATADLMVWDETLLTKVPLGDDEIVIAVLTRESEDGIAEEQFAAYRYAYDSARMVYLTWIVFDVERGRYRRMWSAPTAAARPETISLFTQDLIGDRSGCVIVTGMNDRSEHTMTIFKRNFQDPNEPFITIAELQIDGSIVIQETGRTLAYQQGITTGQSFRIAAYSYDNSSSNILDQLETTYAYNPQIQKYESINVSRIPGSQIEQQRLRELLSGAPGVFQNFINDLWYYVSPQGTIDLKQYMYFDPAAKEIIFFSDETQQVFNWQNSAPTRYGLYITCQNISISTLRRSIDIQLESLDSIRIRVIEDLNLKIDISESWDGSYRRASPAALVEGRRSSLRTAFNALYDSSWGRVRFTDDGEYTITYGGTSRKGRYVFYEVDGDDLLELRPEGEIESRMVYKIDSEETSVLNLSRVRLGITGVQDMLEPPVTLTFVIGE
jgi:hypothetical protein